MVKFCGKCGSQLDASGKCPKCDTNNKASNKSLIIIVIAIILALVLGLIGYKVISNNKSNKITYDTLLANLESRNTYLYENSIVVNELSASTSENILSESGVIRYLNIRGFNSKVYYRYTLSGEELTPSVALDSKEDKHPEYISSYVSSNGTPWLITVINGDISATSLPSLSRPNIEDQITIIEKDTLTIYLPSEDGFYELLPNEEIKDKVTIVEKITSSILDSLTSDTTVNNDIDDTISYVSSTNEAILIESRAFRSLDPNNVDVDQYEYNYSQDGRVISFVVEDTITYIDYDDENSLISLTFDSDDGIHTVRTFDKNNNEIYHAEIGQGIEKEYNCDLVYNEKNQLIEEHLFSGQTSFYYEYYDNGYLYKIISTGSDKEDIWRTVKYEYEDHDEYYIVYMHDSINDTNYNWIYYYSKINNKFPLFPGSMLSTGGNSNLNTDILLRKEIIIPEEDNLIIDYFYQVDDAVYSYDSVVGKSN